MAAALRWRALGRCASQQAREQNISRTRPELQVETEQRKNFAFIAMGFRHIEQTAKGSGMRTVYQAVRSRPSAADQIRQQTTQGTGMAMSTVLPLMSAVVVWRRSGIEVSPLHA